jgi:FtsH-binding integral membrane protein
MHHPSHDVVVQSSRQQSIISNTFLYFWASILTVFFMAWGGYSVVWAIDFTGMLIAWLGCLALVFAISRYRQKMSYMNLLLLYVGFVLLEWYRLAGVIQRYPPELVTQAFVITSGTFLVMSLIGYQMKIDLLKWWNLLLSALVGLLVARCILIIAAMLWFTGGLSAIGFALSVIWVVIFSAFIIYDINELKELAQTGDRRVEIVMAMSIYLTFINLFINILRILGYLNGDD